jgi:hypothetical protein
LTGNPDRLNAGQGVRFRQPVRLSK